MRPHPSPSSPGPCSWDTLPGGPSGKSNHIPPRGVCDICKSKLQLWRIEHSLREASPAKRSRQSRDLEVCSVVRYGSRARMLCTNFRQGEGGAPALGANLLNILSFCIIGKFLPYLEVQVTSILLLRLSRKQGRGFSDEVSWLKLTLWFPTSDKRHHALYCSCSLLT